MATFTKFVFTLAVAVPLALSSVAVQAGGHAAKQKDIVVGACSAEAAGFCFAPVANFEASVCVLIGRSEGSG